MSSKSLRGARIRAVILTLVSVIAALLIGVALLTDLPTRWGWRTDASPAVADHSEVADDDHAGHDHGGHSETESIELSPQARANLRLQTDTVKVGSFTRYVEVPGVVTQWPGQTHVSVTSPLTGVINAINVSRGELIKSGTPLFRLRLTHQDLVKTQETFLAKLGEMDVERREIERLSDVARSGAVAGKTLINRQYERDKLDAGLRAERQSLLLHGLTEEQIDRIEKTRTLIREVIVYAPILHDDQSLHHESLHDEAWKDSPSRETQLTAFQPPESPHPQHLDTSFLVTELEVRRGESVSAGQQLAQLSDYSRLLIEGHAFQRDGDLLRQAAATGAALQAIFEGSGEARETVQDLKVVYIGNEVGRESRSLPFYVGLDNEVERSEVRGDKRYVSWRYKPGQRLTVRLPETQLDNAIVVPKAAVAEEGPERFLFVQNGDHFDQVPVHVLSRDSVNVAIANDGQVWPGQTIAISGAHQLQMALKNQSGGAIDPHAGHNH
ncbi:HlyD family efflux transporter periplasmic adaptor subunit [Roseiconus nitratireducens]|uniref:HlyD family efflux transporter periplasmic adaptor subunit n=1 Tax=Roseiconus nitratireducens TaxID=2605748 RepID=A0A5M6D975_9BACT|nr:efflux RND transporter periplasmic adaptor subunit [Roseiconus nitratireducens]KAA5543030.1 HlyD family efflux transporter periplasmic adaptor subunit [Roseiconus nitratireducens]